MDAVYKITNKVNDKSYIGYSSRGAKDRWYQHCANAFRQNRKSKLYSAMRKYGKENFVVDVIYEGDDALSKENYFIIEFDTKENGYNMTDGGEANRKGVPCSSEQKAKLSAKLKGKKKPPRTPEHSKAISESLKGKDTWNKGKKGEQVAWNKGLRTSPKVCLWEVTKEDGSIERFENLILWCEENGYKTNTLKSRYYKDNFPYRDILSVKKL